MRVAAEKAFAPAAATLLALAALSLAACSPKPDTAKAGATAGTASPQASAQASARGDNAVAAPAGGAQAARNDELPPPTPTPAEGKPAPSASDAPAVTHDARLVRRIVHHYDVLRRDLAADDFEAAKLHAIDVGMAASAGRMTIYQELAAAARDVTQQTEIAGSRTAFRVLSKRLLGVVHDTPLVAGACKAYRCPRTEGYNRWLQLSAAIGNPYEGRAGAGCIEPTRLEP